MTIDEIKEAFEQGNDKEKLKALKFASRIGFKDAESVELIMPQLIGFLKSDNEDLVEFACWTAGQVGINRPDYYNSSIKEIVKNLESKNEKIRANALFALGRIGRSDFSLISDYLDLIISFSDDHSPLVRLGMIWACENIGTNNPNVFIEHLPIFDKLLDDSNTDKVRGEAPEMFRVLGKRIPEVIEKYIPRLKEKTEDECRTTRIHSEGAIRITLKSLEKKTAAANILYK
jgi:vesicle coat complex subunit